MSKKAILFMRVSTLAQTIESQPQQLRAMAYQDGFSDDDIISIGEKESAIKLDEEERKSIEKLKHYIETEDVDTVYCFELSRIARSAKVLFSVRDYLVEHQVQLKCKEPSFSLLEDDRSKGIKQDSQFIFYIFGAFAEQEMKLKKERFARGRKFKAEENKFNGGRIPFGYRVNYDKDKLIEIDEEDANLVRYVFNLYEQGYSQTQIARLLLGTAMERKSTLSVVHNILTNEAYTGRKVKAYAFERRYPQIITPEQFDRCRKLASEHTHSVDKSSNIYYGSKIVRCPECEGRCGAVKSKGYYFCYNAYNAVRDVNIYGQMQCSNTTTISINILDSLLWYVASAAEARHIILDTAQNKIEYEKKIKEIEKKIKNTKTQKKTISEKRERLFDGWVDGRCSEEKYKSKDEEFKKMQYGLDEEIAEYQQQIEQLHRLIDDLTSTWRSINGSDEAAYTMADLDVLVAKIRETTDDTTRSDIIHKHIMKVYVYKEEDIYYTFARGKKLAKMKRIEIQKYQGDPVSYYFLPFGGRKCVFWANPKDNPKAFVEMQYIDRFRDRYKKPLPHKTDDVKDYYRISTLAQELGVSSYMIRKAVREGEIASIFKHGTYYISRSSVEKYMVQLKEKEEISINSISAKDAAKQLGVDIQVVWKLLRNGIIPAHKDGYFYNIPIEAFEAYKNSIKK